MWKRPKMRGCVNNANASGSSSGGGSGEAKVLVNSPLVMLGSESHATVTFA